MMKVLVSGGAGFIGSHIVDHLINGGNEVVIVDNLSTGKEENLNPLANFYKTDIRDAGLNEVFSREQPDYVIHHAAQIDVQTSLRQPGTDAEINILGTINLIRCCMKYAVKKLIYASSAAVYGEPKYLGVDENHPITPISFYGISKYTPESYLRVWADLAGFKYTILRYANVYGPRQDVKGEGGVVAIFIDKLINGVAPVIYGDGNQTRDFVYVKDIAEANLAALHNGDNQVINVSCNSQTSVNQLFNLTAGMMAKKIAPVYQAPRPGDILHSYLDNSKAKQVLNWIPQYDINKGISETIAYYSK